MVEAVEDGTPGQAASQRIFSLQNTAERGTFVATIQR